MAAARFSALLVGFIALLGLGACNDDPSGPGAGELRIQVTGLPAGATPEITIQGPGGYQRTVVSSETLSGLRVGDYTVVAAAVVSGTSSFGALRPSQTVTIERGSSVNIPIEYANLSSALEIQVLGLPSAAVAEVEVRGPDGYVEQVTGSQFLVGLAPGDYTVVGRGVLRGDSTYQPTPLIREVTVQEGAPARAEVVYRVVGGRTLNLRIEQAYVVQVTQTREGRVPLVAGRDGYVRVFAVADQANTATPAVRVTIFHGTDQRAAFDIPAGSGSVSQSMNQADLKVSWNLKIPGELIQPGMGLLAEIDPTGGVAEANEQDNRFPVTGRPAALDVVPLPPTRLSLVPILQTTNGFKGRIDANNAESYLTLLKKIHPGAEYDVHLRETYSTKVSLDPEGATWSLLVSELDAVRVAEGTDRYYYGVVRTPYAGGGVVGIANGIPSRTSLGWDLFPYAPETLAHELGHNWGRYHAPCAGAGGADPSYPYTMGFIGVYGMDVEEGKIKAPGEYTDIMGYCDSSWWISDYTYGAILRYRQANDGPAASMSVPRPSLIVWGRIVDGVPVLEPAFTSNTRPAIPNTPGAYRLEGFDASGATLFTYSFAGSVVHDVPGDVRQFAFAIPVSADGLSHLDRVRVSGGGRSAERVVPRRDEVTRRPIETFPRVQLERAPDGTVAVEWDAALHPLMVVRDPRSGAILSLGRDGSTIVATRARELELVASDGVRAATRRVRLEQ